MAFFNWFKKNKKDDKKNLQDENINLDLQKDDLSIEESFGEILEKEELEEDLEISSEAYDKIQESELSKAENFVEELEEDLEISSEAYDEIQESELSKAEDFVEELEEDLEISSEAYDEIQESELSKAENFVEELEEDLEISNDFNNISEENINYEITPVNSQENNFSEDIQDIKQGQDLQEENLNENEEQKPSKINFFTKIKQGLSKTRETILKGVEQVLSGFTKIDEELFEELEEALIIADIGVDTSLFIIGKVREIVKSEKITNVEEIKNVIIRVITEIMEKDCEDFDLQTPSVILVIGVNGVGKTTSIGKLTNYFKEQNKKVILAAADTFRAAAIDQLEVWGERNNVDVIKHQENSDPAAVVFDAIKASKARKADILICDTAGRLHNKKNLMEELKKIYRIIEREYCEAKVEVLLVLDSTTGQNALQQAKLFSEITNITGLILTKLDGTAKGGIIISIKNELNLPVRFIGIGEGALDLRPFDAKEFATALFDK